MFSFLKKAPKDETTTLVCLVTGYSVAGAIVKTFATPGSVAAPVVLFSCEELLPLRHGRNRVALEILAEDSAKRVLNRCRSFMPVADSLVCVLGEPWISTVSRTAHIEKREAFAVTQKLVDDLVVRESRLFQQDAARDFDGQEEVDLVESSRPLIDVNGYRVFAAASDHAKSLDVHLSFSVAHTSIVDRMLGVFVDVFHRTDPVFRSFDLAKNRLLRDYPEGVVVELGGVSTVLTVAAGSVPGYYASIPAGMADIESAIGHAFDVPRGRVSQVLSFAADLNVLDHVREQYFSRIAAAYRQFGDVFGKHAAEVRRHVGAFQEPVVILGSQDWLPVIAPLLRSDLSVPVIVPPQNLFDGHLVRTHEARTMALPLALAILHVTT